MIWRPQQMTSERGLTLVELLIAMLVLAIGILATMAMQFSALAGYRSASELTAANDVARAVEQMVWVESRQWQQSDGAPCGVTSQITDQPGILATTCDNAGGWNTLYAEPVTYRLGNDDDFEDEVMARYCVYVAGSQMPAADGFGVDPFYRVAIAVVYPRTAQGFPNGCADGAITGNLDVDEEGENDNAIAIETAGYRIMHLSTAVRAQ